MNIRYLSIFSLSIFTIIFIVSIPEIQAQINCQALRQERKELINKIAEIDPLWRAAKGQEKERLKAKYDRLDARLVRVRAELEKNCPDGPPNGGGGIHPAVIAAIIGAIGVIIAALIGLMRIK